MRRAADRHPRPAPMTRVSRRARFRFAVLCGLLAGVAAAGILAQRALAQPGSEEPDAPLNRPVNTVDLPPAHPAQAITMLVQRVEESGEYALAIKPVKAVEVALQNTRVEVRRNVQMPQ